MIGNLMNGLIDKEQIVKDYLTDMLENLHTELGGEYKDYFVMIHSKDAEFTPVCHVMKMNENRVPKLVREITIKEIIGEKSE